MQNRKVPTYPVMELPWVAFLLSISAGSLNGYSYFISKALATIQSGNVFLLGQTIATKNWSYFAIIFVTLFSFGLGSATTATIEYFKKKIWTFEILTIEIIVLVAFGFTTINSLFSNTVICIILSFIGGLQGNAFRKIDGLPYSNVALSLNVRLVFNYFIQGIIGVKNGWKHFFEFTMTLVGASIGAFVGLRLSTNYGEKALWFSAAILIGIAIYIKIIKIENREASIDPTQ